MEAVVCISLEDQSIKFSKIHFEGWKLQHENECRDTNVWRSQIWRFFSDQPFPPPFPALPSNFAGKRGFICQGLQLAEYSFNHMLAYIAVGKKKVCCICLQWTTLTTQENEARNRNTSIGSQMILESWNIWSLNLSFLWATDPNFLLSGSFSHPCGRSAQNPGKLAFMWM